MQRQRHAHADAIAVQRGDDRLDQRNTDAGNGAQQGFGRDHAPGAVDLLDVGAGTECFFAGAGEDGDTHIGVIGDLLPDRSQPLLGRNVERIEYLRAVDRNDRDPVRTLLQQNRHSSHQFATRFRACSRMNGPRRDQPGRYRHACSRQVLPGRSIAAAIDFSDRKRDHRAQVGQRRPISKERHRA